MAEEKKKTTGEKTKKKGIRVFPLLLLLCVLPFIMPTVVLLLGMIPTLVALIADTDEEKSGAICVGSMNFAGVAPFIVELWQKDQTMEAAFAIILDPNTWLVMLGAAAVGRLILFVIPPMVVSLSVAQAENRLVRLKESLIQLKEIWGADVETVTPADMIRKKSEGE